METRDIARVIAIEFAYWLRHNTVRHYHGYGFHVDIKNCTLDRNEYQEDELYDYWIENVYLKRLEA